VSTSILSNTYNGNQFSKKYYNDQTHLLVEVRYKKTVFLILNKLLSYVRLRTSRITLWLNEIRINETIHVTLLQPSTKVFHIPKFKRKIKFKIYPNMKHLLTEAAVTSINYIYINVVSIFINRSIRQQRLQQYSKCILLTTEAAVTTATTVNAQLYKMWNLSCRIIVIHKCTYTTHIRRIERRKSCVFMHNSIISLIGRGINTSPSNLNFTSSLRDSIFNINF
jgi:hypothetical protein